VALSSLVRGVVAGAGLGVALGYAHTNGYNRDAIREANDEQTEYRFGRRSSADEIHGTLWWIVGVATLGGAFGAITAAATRVLPTPALVSGAVVGGTAWASAEAWYRRLPDAQQRWGFPPTRRTLTTLALSGAAVAAASRLP
jgi:hypothetical protein